MRVDVSSILKHPGQTLPFEIEGKVRPLGDDTLEMASPLTVRGVVTSIGNGVYVQANVRGVITLTCSRCLSPFRKNLNLNAEARYLDAGQEQSQKDANDEDDRDICSLDGSFCDLDDMITSEILLNLPMKPLCSPDCKGICPVCGKNLNEGPCECNNDQTKPTLFGEKLLEALKERDKENGRS